MSFYRLYRKGLLSEARKTELVNKLKPVIRGIRDVKTETVFCVEDKVVLFVKTVNRAI